MQFDAVWASLAFGALGCLLLLACRRRGGKDLPKAMRRLVVVEPNADLALARVVVEEEAPLPVLKRGQVLIKVCAASINPSDYGAWRARSAKGEYPLPTGQECSGVVVATGGGVSTLGLLGRRVAAFPGSGTYADYFFINPLTVVAMLLTARAKRAKAIIHTGASSALGQMLCKAAPGFGVEVVHVTHRQQHVEMLHRLGATARGPQRLLLGATHVLNSSSDSYGAQLDEKIRALRVKLAFDCVAGDSAGALVAKLPPRSTVYAYGRLSRLSSSYLSAIPVIDLIYRGKKVEGFMVTRAFAKLGPLGLLRMLLAMQTIKRELQTTFATEFADVRLEEVYERVVAIDPERPGAKSATNQKLRVVFD
ncbi:hypothetical protein EMIHUDRAFT_448649 [Emiliania huxleyi CCMP1516]|uniref:Enoyl reductase (ER) domain-containing protein n=2 Tax=Emiliania huxleyi TaxID=2903 RepID=A0A0D3I2C9_EMIH1|nr:hypothetical protein EMIHUDRAFT_448649 [Emiliania huxleyi CCMP1516]EOD05414.1 hypothetical protein EMIHUDRAFT_448649 [Emiliania huxleyi CCMP1516]|eukprot:XP_005757843.1 hypothetical protein EMIHUDRAFT_448649 [Emiliania huxleyi CCMP1516]